MVAGRRGDKAVGGDSVADPRGINAAVTIEPFPADDHRGFERLLFEARRHSVHFVVLPRLAEMLRAEPESVLRGRSNTWRWKVTGPGPRGQSGGKFESYQDAARFGCGAS